MCIPKQSFECPRCGAEMDEDEDICFDCGAEIDGISWIIDEDEDEFFDHEDHMD